MRPTPSRCRWLLAARCAFEHVRFGYGNAARQVIADFTLTVRAGEKVGLIEGRSGAGKSTLVNLLLRFYDPDGGRILVATTSRTSRRTACAPASAW